MTYHADATTAELEREFERLRLSRRHGERTNSHLATPAIENSSVIGTSMRSAYRREKSWRATSAALSAIAPMSVRE